ncbi:MAG: SPFH/Band 7/PHB domain protein [Methanomicrobium sp.]|jgi:regulator of protease activity HflC (stomatin/prohibitin superfamily)|uniref:SPFH domain-containing protein n=1 Tax=Methanomicrobium mobile TaxID=2205 RepID=UPI0005B27E0C|nr:SPFH domain-containing protein [Methanomicrobium mobile]MBO7388300.1 SPFH/Band 7/PHB domain protein [Methanomicrobium sp.]MBP5083737.1 SPFH/Band 7/PHB domain protein [Methanomicrobium sp.]
MDTALTIVLVIAIVFIFAKGVVIVQPYEQALQIRLGKYIGRLNPGFRWVIPFITEIIKVDLRTQVMDVPKQEVITKDNSPTNVDAIVYVKVIDPEKSYFEVSNYRMATVALAQTSLRGIIGDLELDEVLYNRELINNKLRDILDRETDQWGVKVERVEIKEVDPIGAVKQAMTEQTAAERERRAAILRADGEKRSAILTAEGKRQSMILEAEGDRQSKILRAEGDRKSKILQSQGEAQALRILSLGSRPLDKKAITVLSLNALQQMADGQATKIIFPFEVSSLIKQGAKFLGAEDEDFKDDSWKEFDLDESILGKSPAEEGIDDASEYVKNIEKNIQSLEDPTTPADEPAPES